MGNTPDPDLALLRRAYTAGDDGTWIAAPVAEHLEAAGLLERASTAACDRSLYRITPAGDDVLDGRASVPSTRRVRGILWAQTGRCTWRAVTTDPDTQAPTVFTLDRNGGTWTVSATGEEVARWVYPDVADPQEALIQASGAVLNARDATDRHGHTGQLRKEAV